MPQPIRSPCEIEPTGFGALHKHAEALGHIVALSGVLENRLGHLLAFVSGASANVAIAMFHAVTSADAQRAMLVAAAEQTLSGNLLEEFRAIMLEVRTRYGERNRVVHNIWGTSAEHPGKAVWCHTQDTSGISRIAATMTHVSQIGDLIDEARNMWKYSVLYTVKDLEDIYSRLYAYSETVKFFIFKLQRSHPVLGDLSIAPPDSQLPPA